MVNCHTMKDYIEERVLELANHIVETGATVRSTAAKFRVSKSTVHKDNYAFDIRNTLVTFFRSQNILPRNRTGQIEKLHYSLLFYNFKQKKSSAIYQRFFFVRILI